MTDRIPGIARLLALFWITPIASSVAQGQDLSGCPEAGEYPCGAAMKVSPAKAESLLTALKQRPEQEYGDILKRYLGESYGKHFNDWILFLGKDGTVKQALIVEGAFNRGNLVRGGQTLFTIVFSDTTLQFKSRPGQLAGGDTPAKSPAESAAEDIARIAKRCATENVQCSLQVPVPAAGGKDGDGSAGSGDALQLSRVTLRYTREAALTALFKGISKNILGDVGQVAVVPDTVQGFAMLDVVRHDSTPVKLYVGFKRLGLPNNALVRYTLRANEAGKSYDLPNATAVSRTIENASGSRFGASLGLGVTGDAPDSTFAFNHDSTDVLSKSSSSPWKPNAWVLAHFYITRPQLPIAPTSVSVVAGTNVGVSDLFRDLLVGLSVDRLFGDVGVMGGLNFIERQTTEGIDRTEGTGSTAAKFHGLRTRSYRKGKAFAGINLAF